MHTGGWHDRRPHARMRIHQYLTMPAVNLHQQHTHVQQAVTNMHSYSVQHTSPFLMLHAVCHGLETKVKQERPGPLLPSVKKLKYWGYPFVFAPM